MSDTLQDIRNWRTLGLPIAAEWCAQGGHMPGVVPANHDLAWHVRQIRDFGRRMLPVAVQVVKRLSTIPKQTSNLDAYAEEYKWISDNQLPLVLEHQTQLAEDVNENYRLALPDSAAQWRIKPEDGTLDSTPVCDPFAPIEPSWMVYGREAATSPFMEHLQELCPNPLYIMWQDNDEAGYSKNPKPYCNINKLGVHWKSEAELNAISIRHRDYVYGNGGVGSNSDPHQYWPKFFADRARQFMATFNEFRSNWRGGWKGKELVTLGYAEATDSYITPPDITAQIGTAPKASAFDGSGPSMYLDGAHVGSNLLEPIHESSMMTAVKAWEFIEAKNPNAFRVVFISASPKPMVTSAKAGQHEVIDPPMFAGYCGWMAWLAQKPGVPVCLNHWIGSGTDPHSLFFKLGDPAKQAQLVQDLSDLGRTDLLDTIHEEYSLANTVAVDRICSDDVRGFWMKGQRITATASDFRVRVVAIKLDQQMLLYVWTPCKLSGPVDIQLPDFDPITIDAPSIKGDYWIVENSSAEKDAAEAAADLAEAKAADANLAAKAAEEAAAFAVEQAQNAREYADSLPTAGVSATKVSV